MLVSAGVKSRIYQTSKTPPKRLWRCPREESGQHV